MATKCTKMSSQINTPKHYFDLVQRLNLIKILIQHTKSISIPYAVNRLFSSSELSGSDCELKIYQCSGVRPLAFHLPSSKIYSKTDSPFKATFLVQPPLDKGIKIYIKCVGKMTKMAASLYGKSFKIVLRTGSPMILKPGLHFLSLVLRKPVFGASDQVRHKPGCTATGDS